VIRFDQLLLDLVGLGYMCICLLFVTLCWLDTLLHYIYKRCECILLLVVWVCRWTCFVFVFGFVMSGMSVVVVNLHWLVVVWMRQFVFVFGFGGFAVFRVFFMLVCISGARVLGGLVVNLFLCG